MVMKPLVSVAQMQLMDRDFIFIMEVVCHHALQAITQMTAGFATSVMGFVQHVHQSTIALLVSWDTFMTVSAIAPVP